MQALGQGDNYATSLSPAVREILGPHHSRLVSAYLEPEIQKKFTTQTAKKYIATYKQMPSPDALAGMVELGRVGMNWYRLANNVMADFCPNLETQWRFTAVMASTSPNKSVTENVKLALQCYETWVDMPDHLKNDRNAVARRLWRFFLEDETPTYDKTAPRGTSFKKKKTPEGKVLKKSGSYLLTPDNTKKALTPERTALLDPRTGKPYVVNAVEGAPVYLEGDLWNTVAALTSDSFEEWEGRVGSGSDLLDPKGKKHKVDPFRSESFKVRNFGRALMGMFNYFVGDVHMGKIAGVGGKALESNGVQYTAQAVFRFVADHLSKRWGIDVGASDIQAAIWAPVRIMGNLLEGVLGKNLYEATLRDAFYFAYVDDELMPRDDIASILAGRRLPVLSDEELAKMSSSERTSYLEAIRKRDATQEEINGIVRRLRRIGFDSERAAAAYDREFPRLIGKGPGGTPGDFVIHDDFNKTFRNISEYHKDPKDTSKRPKVKSGYAPADVNNPVNVAARAPVVERPGPVAFNGLRHAEILDPDETPYVPAEAQVGVGAPETVSAFAETASPAVPEDQQVSPARRRRMMTFDLQMFAEKPGTPEPSVPQAPKKTYRIGVYGTGPEGNNRAVIQDWVGAKNPEITEFPVRELDARNPVTLVFEAENDSEARRFLEENLLPDDKRPLYLTKDMAKTFRLDPKAATTPQEYEPFQIRSNGRLPAKASRLWVGLLDQLSDTDEELQKAIADHNAASPEERPALEKQVQRLSRTAEGIMDMMETFRSDVETQTDGLMDDMSDAAAERYETWRDQWTDPLEWEGLTKDQDGNYVHDAGDVLASARYLDHGPENAQGEVPEWPEEGLSNPYKPPQEAPSESETTQKGRSSVSSQDSAQKSGPRMTEVFGQQRPSGLPNKVTKWIPDKTRGEINATVPFHDTEVSFNIAPRGKKYQIMVHKPGDSMPGEDWDFFGAATMAEAKEKVNEWIKGYKPVAYLIQPDNASSDHPYDVSYDYNIARRKAREMALRMLDNGVDLFDTNVSVFRSNEWDPVNGGWMDLDGNNVGDRHQFSPDAKPVHTYNTMFDYPNESRRIVRGARNPEYRDGAESQPSLDARIAAAKERKAGQPAPVSQEVGDNATLDEMGTGDQTSQTSPEEAASMTWERGERVRGKRKIVIYRSSPDASGRRFSVQSVVRPKTMPEGFDTPAAGYEVHIESPNGSTRSIGPYKSVAEAKTAAEAWSRENPGAPVPTDEQVNNAALESIATGETPTETKGDQVPTETSNDAATDTAIREMAGEEVPVSGAKVLSGLLKLKKNGAGSYVVTTGLHSPRYDQPVEFDLFKIVDPDTGKFVGWVWNASFDSDIGSDPEPTMQRALEALRNFMDEPWAQKQMGLASTPAAPTTTGEKSGTRRYAVETSNYGTDYYDTLEDAKEAARTVNREILEMTGDRDAAKTYVYQTGDDGRSYDTNQDPVHIVDRDWKQAIIDEDAQILDKWMQENDLPTIRKAAFNRLVDAFSGSDFLYDPYALQRFIDKLPAERLRPYLQSGESFSAQDTSLWEAPISEGFPKGVVYSWSNANEERASIEAILEAKAPPDPYYTPTATQRSQAKRTYKELKRRMEQARIDLEADRTSGKSSPEPEYPTNRAFADSSPDYLKNFYADKYKTKEASSVTETPATTEPSQDPVNRALESVATGETPTETTGNDAATDRALADIAGEEVPDAVPDETQPRVSYDTLIKIAADSVENLRRSDVFRVLDSAPEDLREGLAEYIRENRPDLAQEIEDWIIESRPEEPRPVPRAPSYDLMEHPSGIPTDGRVIGTIDGDYSLAITTNHDGSAYQLLRAPMLLSDPKPSDWEVVQESWNDPRELLEKFAHANGGIMDSDIAQTTDPAVKAWLAENKDRIDTDISQGRGPESYSDVENASGPKKTREFLRNLSDEQIDALREATRGIARETPVEGTRQFRNNRLTGNDIVDAMTEALKPFGLSLDDVDSNENYYTDHQKVDILSRQIQREFLSRRGLGNPDQGTLDLDTPLPESERYLSPEARAERAAQDPVDKALEDLATPAAPTEPRAVAPETDTAISEMADGVNNLGAGDTTQTPGETTAPTSNFAVDSVKEPWQQTRQEYVQERYPYAREVELRDAVRRLEAKEKRLWSDFNKRENHPQRSFVPPPIRNEIQRNTEKAIAATEADLARARAELSSYLTGKGSAEQEYYQRVKQAISEGKPVPVEVLTASMGGADVAELAAIWDISEEEMAKLLEGPAGSSSGNVPQVSTSGETTASQPGGIPLDKPLFSLETPNGARYDFKIQQLPDGQHAMEVRQRNRVEEPNTGEEFWKTVSDWHQEKIYPAQATPEEVLEQFFNYRKEFLNRRPEFYTPIDNIHPVVAPHVERLDYKLPEATPQQTPQVPAATTSSRPAPPDPYDIIISNGNGVAVTDEGIIAQIKRDNPGIDPRNAYNEYVKATGLRPSLDMKEFLRLFAATSEASGSGRVVRFAPTHYDTVTDQYVMIEPPEGGKGPSRVTFQNGMTGTVPNTSESMERFEATPSAQANSTPQQTSQVPAATPPEIAPDPDIQGYLTQGTSLAAPETTPASGGGIPVNETLVREVRGDGHWDFRIVERLGSSPSSPSKYEAVWLNYENGTSEPTSVNYITEADTPEAAFQKMWDSQGPEFAKVHSEDPVAIQAHEAIKAYLPEEMQGVAPVGASPEGASQIPVEISPGTSPGSAEGDNTMARSLRPVAGENSGMGDLFAEPGAGNEKPTGEQPPSLGETIPDMPTYEVVNGPRITDSTGQVRDVVLVRGPSLPGGEQAFYRSSGVNSGKAGYWLPFDGLKSTPGGLWFDKARFTSGENRFRDSPLHRYGTDAYKDASLWLGLQEQLTPENFQPDTSIPGVNYLPDGGIDTSNTGEGLQNAAKINEQYFPDLPDLESRNNAIRAVADIMSPAPPAQPDTSAVDTALEEMADQPAPRNRVSGDLLRMTRPGEAGTPTGSRVPSNFPSRLISMTPEAQAISDLADTPAPAAPSLPQPQPPRGPRPAVAPQVLPENVPASRFPPAAGPQERGRIDLPSQDPGLPPDIQAELSRISGRPPRSLRGAGGLPSFGDMSRDGGVVPPMPPKPPAGGEGGPIEEAPVPRGPRFGQWWVPGSMIASTVIPEYEKGYAGGNHPYLRTAAHGALTGGLLKWGHGYDKVATPLAERLYDFNAVKAAKPSLVRPQDVISPLTRAEKFKVGLNTALQKGGNALMLGQAANEALSAPYFTENEVGSFATPLNIGQKAGGAVVGGLAATEAAGLIGTGLELAGVSAPGLVAGSAFFAPAAAAAAGGYLASKGIVEPLTRRYYGGQWGDVKTDVGAAPSNPAAAREWAQQRLRLANQYLRANATKDAQGHIHFDPASQRQYQKIINETGSALRSKQGLGMSAGAAQNVFNNAYQSAIHEDFDKYNKERGINRDFDFEKSDASSLYNIGGHPQAWRKPTVGVDNWGDRNSGTNATMSGSALGRVGDEPISKEPNGWLHEFLGWTGLF